jgi:hypothetical protein
LLKVLDSSIVNGSESPPALIVFFGGVARPGRPAAEDGEDEKRLADGRRPGADGSFGSGSIGMGGIVDLDEFDVVGVGNP